jgi:hypothetical protein
MRYTILFFLFFVVQSACKKTAPDNNDTVDITGSSWRISYFWDVHDKTSTYSNYYFMFESGGILMAHGSSATMYTGTWSQTATRININFTSAPANDLNGDWLKTEFTNSSIKLKDDSPSQDDQLYFVKN